MTMGRRAWRMAASLGLTTPPIRRLAAQPAYRRFYGSSASSRLLATSPANGGKRPSSLPMRYPYTSISESQKQKKELDREFLVSVLETSATKRDTKAYMNKFGPVLERKAATRSMQRTSHAFKDKNNLSESSTAEKDSTDVTEKIEAVRAPKPEEGVAFQEPLYVAIVKFRAPQEVSDSVLNGVGKTLSLLGKLGLASVIVVDAEEVGQNDATRRHEASLQADRIALAINSYDVPGARVINSPVTIGSQGNQSTSPFVSQGLYVENATDLMIALKEDVIPIIPFVGCTEDACTIKSVNADEVVLALTRQLSGLQFVGHPAEETRITRLVRAAEVYRIIILDPLGGIPARNRATGRHLFLNLEHEFPEVKNDLTTTNPSTLGGATSIPPANLQHLKNAELAKATLSLLPPTSSAVITTPQEVVKERSLVGDNTDYSWVKTRRKQNPLIHSLLTDKPIKSSSLPPERFGPALSATGLPEIGSMTTLAKRGMPLTIFPDPRVEAWRPPRPGDRGLQLTDPCIDLPRLVNLIEDSFGRKLDVGHYLKRINGNLAGIIIAGEYEGGALLTWEKPIDQASGVPVEDPDRFVPYLDKFAVLRKSQGAGGVADIVFNAMVRDCFPQGVCWRSRKDNPVNKWYFERSRGHLSIAGMNWKMFYTTPSLGLNSERFEDYKSVCRSVEPSWADKKHIVD